MNNNIAILIFIIFHCNLFGQDLTQGIVAHWQLNNGVAIDSSDNGIDGELISPIVIEDRYGNPNGAVAFDGTDSYARFDDVLDDVFSINDAQFSVSLWFKSGTFAPTVQTPIICKSSHSQCSDNDRSWALNLVSDLMIFYYSPTGDNVNFRQYTVQNFITEADTWYHIVLNYDGSVDSQDGEDRVEVYLDNVLQLGQLLNGIGVIGDSLFNSSAHLSLMANVRASGDACGDIKNQGALDDIRIYDRLLLDSEVTMLFEEMNTVSNIDENIDVSIAVEISPNPVVGDQILNLKIKDEHKISSATIFDLTGKIIQKIKLENQSAFNSIRLNNLSSGIYVLQLSTIDGFLSNKKFVVE